MMIELHDLKKQYGDAIVLDIPSLSVSKGEIVGLVGNNGAGKTTMMRLVLDLIKASGGYVTINSKKVSEDPQWKAITGSYLDSTFLIDFYTPEEYFGFVAQVYDIPDADLKERLKEYDVLMGGEIMGKKKLIHDFSNGNRQKIGIIAAMLVNPEILILDEPFNYLDPSSQIVVAKLIRDMNARLGTTVIVSSHNLTSINDISNRIILLDKGKVLIDKEHRPQSTDQELEDYFLSAVR